MRLEIEKLLYQINPHFLMNTLNTIHWMAVMNGQQDIDKAVQALNRLLFYNLDKDGYHTDIERELSAMGEYMLLQKVRLYDFTYTIRREPETAEFCYPIPKFILQPVIENSIVHGYRSGIEMIGWRLRFPTMVWEFQMNSLSGFMSMRRIKIEK